MKKILLQLVKVIKNERYVIIKLKENFPNNFNKGSDLDILCEDKNKLIFKFRTVINNFLLSNIKHQIKIIELSQSHCQIDFLIKNTLLFKLDIFDEYEMSGKLKNKILDNKINKQFKYFSKFIKDERMKNTFKTYLNRGKNDLEVFFDLIKKYISQINYFKYKLNKHSLNEISTLVIKKFIEK